MTSVPAPPARPAGLNGSSGAAVAGEAAPYRALVEVLSALHDVETLTELEIVLTRRIGDVIPNDLVTLNRIDLTGVRASIGLFVPEFVSPRVIEPAFDRYVDQHPLVQEMKRTGDGRPRRMSDFTDMDAFRRTELYHQVFRPLRSLHQIGFQVRTDAGLLVGIGVNRTYVDFTDAELALVTVLYEQLPAALDHARLRELHHRGRRSGGAAELTDREFEVLLYVRAGMSNQQIADALHVGRRTVEKHLERAFAKLGVQARTAAVHAVWPPAEPG